ncbi:MAG: DUF3108 domain-containing protein [Pseudomonadota bacterium]
MTIALSFFQRRRKVMAFCVATAGLHYLTLGWLGGHIGPMRSAPPKVVPPPIIAQLRLALPPAAPREPGLSAPARPAPAAVATPPKPARKARPKPPPDPEPTLEPAPDTPPEPEPAPPETAEEAVDAPATSAAPRPGSGKGRIGPALAPAEAQAAEPVSAPTAPPKPPRRTYKVDMPQAAQFTLDLKRVDADGTVWNGVGAMSWQPAGERYKLTVEAGLSMLVTRINLLVLTSEGLLDGDGIAPLTATEKRKGRSLTATHFNREEGRITFSASERSYPLPPGAQDKATVPFQLAAIGRGDVNQFGADIDLFVGEDKEASLFRFVLVGEEELETGMGRLVTWHLTRPPRPGSYSSRLDVWLAPARGWYPVQIRNTESNGAVTTQTVSNITVTEPSGK